MIPDVVRISQPFEDFGARRAVRRLAAGAQWRIHLDQSPFNRAAELVPALLGRPSGIGWPDARESWFCLAVVRPGGGELPQFRTGEQGNCGRRIEQLSSVHWESSRFDKTMLAGDAAVRHTPVDVTVPERVRQVETVSIWPSPEV